MMIDFWVGAGSASQTSMSFGHWVLAIRQRGSTSNPSLVTSTLDSEVDNPIIWASGSWMANQNPVPVFVNPRTSRNIPKGATLVLIVQSSPLSAFTVRIHGTAHWFETVM